jgi:hypothetical protein
MLEKDLCTEVDNLLIDGKIRKSNFKEEPVDYSFKEYCFIGQLSSKYALQRMNQVAVINEVKRCKILQDLGDREEEKVQLHMSQLD